LTKLPNELQTYLGKPDPQAFGGPILERFPKMLQTLTEYTRFGADNGQAVLRCYLPAIAGHNLLAGSELALSQVPALSIDDVALPAADKIEATDALKKIVSLSFARDTLENCLALLSQEIGVEIEILGTDLQREGITKNQSFGLNERDKPAIEILRRVLKLANPDGKLIYVIKPNSLGRSTIYITTRAAADKRGDPLPPEVASESKPKG
jgi:hypothetical protein